MQTTNETARRAVHFAVGGLAFLLRDLTPLQAACAAGAAILFNVLVLPRVAPSLFRGEERDRPWRSGVVIYPVAVLLLVLLFHRHKEVAGAAWGIMAAGDSAAGLVGRRYGRRPIPWNRSKTVEGSFAFAIAATLFSWTILIWMGRGGMEAAFLAGSTSLFAAFMESLPWRLNDNLTVPLLSGAFLAGLVQFDADRFAAAVPGIRIALLIGLAVNAILAFLFRATRTVDRSGMIAGFLVGVLTFALAGWRGFLVLIAFFVLGSGATRLGLRRKERAGIAQEKKGARSARHALANCSVGVYLAFLVSSSASPKLFALAFVCAYATAAFDTVSSEIGRAYGGRPVLITTLRPVPAGTDGAVSWLGTLAGLVAAWLVCGVAVSTGLIGGERTGIVLAAAFVGSTADSMLGATLEARGLIDNEAVNFSNTLVGALTGITLASWL
ncbi:MAG: hypothetical protein DMF51_06190 [Acidobacteria bacterium]|nr:MAG: hypothetical protein DMF51_06190 [Acidobacteriota bacterium]